MIMDWPGLLNEILRISDSFHTLNRRMCSVYPVLFYSLECKDIFRSVLLCYVPEQDD